MLLKVDDVPVPQRHDYVFRLVAHQGVGDPVSHPVPSAQAPGPLNLDNPHGQAVKVGARGQSLDLRSSLLGSCPGGSRLRLRVEGDRIVLEPVRDALWFAMHGP